MFCVLTGMYSSLRDIAGRDKRDTGHSAIQSVSGSEDSLLPDQQHGQDNDSGERCHLRNGGDSGDRVRGGEQAEDEEAPHSGGTWRRQNADGGRTPGGLLPRLQPWAPLLLGHPQRLHHPQRLGPSLRLQQQESQPFENVPC